jgi:hypothetical protein
MEEKKKYPCKKCDKLYSSHSSLCNHNKRFHSINILDSQKVNSGQPKVNPSVIQNSRLNSLIDEKENNYTCRYCDNEYKYKQSRWKHEIKCKIKMDKINEEILKQKEENIKQKEECIKQKEESIKQKDEIIRLQKKLLTAKRIDAKSFKALNKILIERSTINSHNNNTINNNNYQILSLGNENILNVLTMQQKKQILNSKLNSIEKLVEIAHCGEMNQFKNIIVTNLKDNYAYRYDDSKGYFIAVQKSTLLDNLIMVRLTDIEEIYDELKTANKIDERTKKIIQNFLDKMEETETPVVENDIKYDNYRSFKIDSIKILLYNNQDKITKNIALLISDNSGESNK